MLLKEQRNFSLWSESLLEEEEQDEYVTELSLAGLDPEELAYMDEDERREVLENAGLDPDDYDF